MIPQSFWQQLRPVLEATKPDILMLGEEDDIAWPKRPSSWITDGICNRHCKLLPHRKQRCRIANLLAESVERMARRHAAHGLLQDWDLARICRYTGARPHDGRSRFQLHH